MKQTSKPVADFVAYLVKKLRGKNESSTKEKLASYLKTEMILLKNLYALQRPFIFGCDDEIIDGVSAELFN